MARKRIEFIDEYLCPGDEDGGYHDCDYQYHDNHGILIRCKDCVNRWTNNCPVEVIFGQKDYPRTVPDVFPYDDFFLCIR